MVATAWAVVLLAGCGEDSPQQVEAERSTSPSASSSISPTPAEESEESAPVATGPVLRMPSGEVTLPEGWQRFDQLVPATDSARLRGGTGVITLSEVDSFDDSTNDELAKITMGMPGRVGQLRQLEDVEVDGVAMYRIVNKEGAKD